MTIERLRGRANQEQRKRCWLSDPRCTRCGLVTAFPSGFELDHIIALVNGGTNDDSNMQVLDHACHEAKTNEDLGYTPKVATGTDGWPVEVTGSVSATARWKRVDKKK